MRSLLILASLGFCASAAATPITVPTSLNPGDGYRLAFVTSSIRNGASPDIASYDAFVSSVANTQPALASLGTTWKAIASISTVDARNNTGTNPLVDGVGVPIFLLNDTLLARDNFDLWDGSILVPLMIDESGATNQQSYVWTGTTSSGTAHAWALGSENPVIGLNEFVTSGWIDAATYFSFLQEPAYAVSDVLVVIPEPGTAVLIGIGLFGMASLPRRVA